MQGTGKWGSSVGGEREPQTAAAKDFGGAVITCATVAVTEVEAATVGMIRTGTDGREAGIANSACQSNSMAVVTTVRQIQNSKNWL